MKAKAVNKPRGRGQESKQEDQMEGHVNETYELRIADLPNLIGKQQVATISNSKYPTELRKSPRLSAINGHRPISTPKRRRASAPKRFKTPDRIVVPGNVKDMDLAMSILLYEKNSIPDFDKDEYSSALGTIIRLRNSAAWRNSPFCQPQGRPLIPIRVDEAPLNYKLEFEKISKLKMELEGKIEELTADRDKWKSLVEKSNEKLEVGKKSRDVEDPRLNSSNLSLAPILDSPSSSTFKELLLNPDDYDTEMGSAKEDGEDGMIDENVNEISESSSVMCPHLDFPPPLRIYDSAPSSPPELELGETTNNGKEPLADFNGNLRFEKTTSNPSSSQADDEKSEKNGKMQIRKRNERKTHDKNKDTAKTRRRASSSSKPAKRLSLSRTKNALTRASKSKGKPEAEKTSRDSMTNPDSRNDRPMEVESDNVITLFHPFPVLLLPYTEGFTKIAKENGEDAVIDDNVNKISSDSESSSDFNDDLCPCLDSPPPPRIIDPAPSSPPGLELNVNKTNNRTESLTEFRGNSPTPHTTNNPSTSQVDDDKSEKKGKMQTRNRNERKTHHKNKDTVKTGRRASPKSIPAKRSITTPTLSRTKNALARTSKSKGKPEAEKTSRDFTTNPDSGNDSLMEVESENTNRIPNISLHFNPFLERLGNMGDLFIRMDTAKENEEDISMDYNSSDSESTSDFNDDLCPCLDSPPPPPNIIDSPPSSPPGLEWNNLKNITEPLTESRGNSGFQQTTNNPSTSRADDERNNGEMQTINRNERNAHDKKKDTLAHKSATSTPAKRSWLSLSRTKKISLPGRALPSRMYPH